MECRMTTFAVSDFFAYLNSGQVSASTDFTVIVSRNQNATTTNMATNGQALMYRTDSVNLPGRTVSTMDHVVYGLATPMAYGSRVSNEITTTVILSEDLREKLYFERWIDEIVGPYRTVDHAKNMYDIKYLKDYSGTLLISVYDAKANCTYQITCTDAFPVEIADGNLSWARGSEGGVSRLTVKYKFKRYKELNSTVGNGAAEAPQSESNATDQSTATATSPNATQAVTQD